MRQSAAEQAAPQARAAAEQAQAGADQARATADQARAATRAARGAEVPDPARARINGITFGDGEPPITVDFSNGNLILHQGEATTSIPWRDVVPRGAVQIAWAIPATLSILVIWWPLTRALTGWLRRRATVAQDMGALEATLRERFESVERNVDTVAIELERLAEGQRFTNKLLSDRQGGVAVSAAPVREPVPEPVREPVSEAVPVHAPAGRPRA